MNDHLEEFSEHTRTTCPNCDALNPLNAVICVACGINLRIFESHADKLVELQKQREEDLLKDIIRNENESLKIEKSRSRKELLKQLGFAVLFLFIAGIIAALFIINQANTINERRALVNQTLRDGAECYLNQNYLCAIEKFEEAKEFEEYLSIDLASISISDLILATRGELGKQYLTEGSWEEAIEQFELALRQDPSRDYLAELKQEAYFSWLDEAKENKRFFEQLYIRWFFDP